ncbi:MAG: hypothetical protein KF764_12505 [Labilithrix sp.]|nr:hypothetical protein [Labilithrix sp.]MBX3223773.1 hypothetical protein [Labilithrix sp.]
MFLDALDSCAELTTEHADEAARSAASLRTLLAWAADVARPGDGGPKVLMALARLASADWFEGTPYIEIRGDGLTTTLSVFADHGMGIRERVVPLARLQVGFDEFARAVRLAPQLIAPFEPTLRGDAILLTPPEAADDATQAGRESIAIDDRSLHEQERRTAPPPPVASDGAPVTHAPPQPPDQSGVHTHPTVRRMVAVRPEALRQGNDEGD